MPEAKMEEAQELLIGTWISIALLANMLIDQGVLSKEELLWTLLQIEEAASDERRTALAGLRRLISRGFRCASLPANTGHCPRESGHQSARHWSPLLQRINIRSCPSDITANFRAFIDIGVDERHRKK
jgi:hypothetical protein